MWRRFVRALAYAGREENFGPVLGTGAFLVIVGTITYSLGNGWNVVDAFYFAVATLTTSSIADPELVLEDGWMKLFTVFYVLVGIGILVEVLRRLGRAFIEVRQEEKRPVNPRQPESIERFTDLCVRECFNRRKDRPTAARCGRSRSRIPSRSGRLPASSSAHGVGSPPSPALRAPGCRA
jgi:Ion channel